MATSIWLVPADGIPGHLSSGQHSRRQYRCAEGGAGMLTKAPFSFPYLSVFIHVYNHGFKLRGKDHPSYMAGCQQQEEYKTTVARVKVIFSSPTVEIVCLSQSLFFR